MFGTYFADGRACAVGGGQFGFEMDVVDGVFPFLFEIR